MITADRAAEIRELYALGIRQREIAARYHMAQCTISKIVRGELHADADGPRAVTRPRGQCCECQTELVGKAKYCPACQRARKHAYNDAYYTAHFAAPTKRRYSTRAHYDMREGVIDGYQIVDRQTGDVYGLYPRRRASYLARKWNKAYESEVTP